MLKSKLLMLLGFGVGTLAGFAYGQTVRKNTGNHVETSYSNGVVSIDADVKNLAKDSFTEMKDTAKETLNSYLDRFRG